MAKIVKHFVEGAFSHRLGFVFLVHCFSIRVARPLICIHISLALCRFPEAGCFFDFGLFDIVVHCSFGMGVMFDFLQLFSTQQSPPSNVFCHGDDETMKQTSVRNVYDLRGI